MRHEGLPLQAVAGEDEAVGVRVHIGIIDLREVADEDDLAAFAHARDERLGFVRRELLRFIHDENRVRDGASADVRDGFDLQDARPA